MLIMLIISEDLHISGLLPDTRKGVFDCAVGQVAVKVDKEPVLPGAVRNRPALDTVHVQIVIDKV